MNGAKFQHLTAMIHGEIAFRRFFGDAGAQFLGNANAPWRSGRKLFALDEPIFRSFRRTMMIGPLNRSPDASRFCGQQTQLFPQLPATSPQRPRLDSIEGEVLRGV
jgi:hypothetical protein